MTPTEQDKELREAILLEFKNVHRLAPADYTENCTNIVMQLITADRKRVALEAKLETAEHIQNTMVHEAGGYCDEILPDAIPNYIAELKAQQEEV
jgi:hypothetical protein